MIAFGHAGLAVMVAAWGYNTDDISLASSRHFEYDIFGSFLVVAAVKVAVSVPGYTGSNLRIKLKAS